MLYTHNTVHTRTHTHTAMIDDNKIIHKWETKWKMTHVNHVIVIKHYKKKKAPFLVDFLLIAFKLELIDKNKYFDDIRYLWKSLIEFNDLKRKYVKVSKA